MEAIAALDVIVRFIVMPAALIVGFGVLVGYAIAAHREGMARLAAYEAREAARERARR